MYNDFRQTPRQYAYQEQQFWLRQLHTQSGMLALACILSILLLYLLQIIGPPLMMVVLAPITRWIPIDMLNELYTFGVYLLVFLPPFWVYARVIRFPLRAIPHDRLYLPITLSATGIGLGTSAAGVALSMIFAVLFSAFGLYPADIPISIPNGPITFLLFFCNMTVLPALVEEFINRGILLGSLRPYGDRFAIVVSALLFGLMHRNMTQFPNAFLMGLVIGYFVVKTNSIWTGIVIHFVNNALSVLVSLAVERMDPLGAIVSQLALFVLYVMLAIAGLVYLRFVRRVDFSIYPSACPVPQGMIYRKFFGSLPMVLLLILFAWVFFLNFSRW